MPPSGCPETGTTLLLDGLVLIVAGVLIWSIDWSVRSLSTFLGALFIFEGIWVMLTAGISGRGANFATGLLSIAAGIAIIAWPGPSLTVLGIFLGCWLIVIGTISISGAFAARRVLPNWWLLLLLGLAEVPLGVLALAAPGATLAALVTVAGIWAVVIGVMRVVPAAQWAASAERPRGSRSPSDNVASIACSLVGSCSTAPPAFPTTERK